MSRSSLARGVVFAGFAALAAPFFWWNGFGHTGDTLLLLVVAHVAVVAPNPRNAVRASALATFLALGCALFIRDQLVLSAFSLVILGLVRSALLYPRPFLRALLAEVFFLGCGGVAALVWASPGPFSVALSSFTFWLVQSGFALTSETVEPRRDQPADAFERAQQIAEAVLAGRPR